MRCADGDYLVGLRARAGDWVDAIAPMCARWDERRQAFLEPGIANLQGGPGGQIVDIRCDNASAIGRMIVEQAPNQWHSVAMIVPTCVSARDPSRQTQRVGPDQFGRGIADRLAEQNGPDVGTSTTVDYNWSAMPQCREGDIAVGIYGGAGNYVDRIGLLCAPAPRRMVILLPPVASPPPNPGDIVRESPILAAARCRTGFVWREASPSDLVCVPPESRTRTQHENAVAASRVNPNGAYGPNTCIAGFVWREAFNGDVVCVTPEVRALVREENNLGPSRTAH